MLKYPLVRDRSRTKANFSLQSRSFLILFYSFQFISFSLRVYNVSSGSVRLSLSCCRSTGLQQDPQGKNQSCRYNPRELCLFGNKSWCRTAPVSEPLSTPDIKLLSISIWPLYLSREFPQLLTYTKLRQWYSDWCKNSTSCQMHQSI